MIENPIVDEIHQIRAQMLAEFGGDFDALVTDLQRRDKESSRESIAVPPQVQQEFHTHSVSPISVFSEKLGSIPLNPGE